MKKLLLVNCLLIILRISAFSQEYISIPDTLASWDCISVLNADEQSWEDLVKYESYGDTIINHISYIKIFKTLQVSYFVSKPPPVIYTPANKTKSFYGLLRNTTDGKVYTLDDTIEYLMYDFSLKPNDSLKIYPTEDQYFYVLNCDSILINGEYRRRLEVTTRWSCCFDFSSFWVEGIGSLNGLFANKCIQGEKSYYWLGCFKIDNNVLVSEGSYACYDFLTGIEKEKSPQNIEVNPLPVIEVSNIKIPDSFDFKTLNIYNINLCKIYQNANSDKNNLKINRNQFSPGIYFLEIIDKKGNRIMKKIVIE